MAEQATPTAHTDEAEHAAHSHPGAKTYIIIGVILTVITAVEVAIFYIPALHPALAPILLSLSALKFALVVMFYMHLRFDSKLFSTVFFAPMVLAFLVIFGLLMIFKVVPGYNP
jgi:cytochrome c oxidase subunit IV